MLRIMISLIIYALSFIGVAQTNELSNNNIVEATAYQINVVINEIGSDEGKIYFGLYDSQSNFNLTKPIRAIPVAINNGVAMVLFEGLPSGTYAITCFHDANNNGKMDFGPNGMPKEDYGLTNNVVNFGPPQFSDGKFELTDKDLTFEIRF